MTSRILSGVDLDGRDRAARTPTSRRAARATTSSSCQDVQAAPRAPARARPRMISRVMPATLMSIWSAVMPSAVPATLKSMSPKVIFVAEDVGQDGVTCRSALRDQAHRHAGDRRLDAARRRPSAPACRRRRRPSRTSRWTRATPTRGGWCTGTPPATAAPEERALGERAMADLAAAGAAHQLLLAGRCTAGSCSGGGSSWTRPGRWCRCAGRRDEGAERGDR